MANYSPSMESARDLVLKTKADIAKKYSPPPVCKMKYRIEDKRFHSCFFFKTKKKLNYKLKQLKKLPDFAGRFRIILNNK